MNSIKFLSFLTFSVQLLSLATLLLTTPIFTQKGIYFVVEAIGLILIIWTSIFLFYKSKFSPFPQVRNNAVLLTNGPYRYTRNPIYLGILLIAFSLIASFFSTERFIIGLILLSDLVYKIKLEERFLEEKFGKKFKDYKNKTNKLIPFIY